MKKSKLSYYLGCNTLSIDHMLLVILYSVEINLS